MEKEQKVQQTQINGNAKKFPPYFGIFENEVSKEFHMSKVTASCKENVRCKPYLIIIRQQRTTSASLPHNCC